VEDKNKDGNDITKSRRNTDILLKQKDRWILIGDRVGFLVDRK